METSSIRHNLWGIDVEASCHVSSVIQTPPLDLQLFILLSVNRTFVYADVRLAGLLTEFEEQAIHMLGLAAGNGSLHRSRTSQWTSSQKRWDG
ncbi:unnamed protein product [Rhizoctonia solani]|uniref:Uncharacterized protein n=1 Tax=Rhizoctonia solani TaxID=456999 RepID=A0A8H3DVW2_9AGAM|nr:unnamed protein product [Rhizoctonia solani]